MSRWPALQGGTVTVGEDFTKKAAQQHAARLALEVLLRDSAVRSMS